MTVGQTVFDALGQGTVQGVNGLSQALTDGLVSLSKEQHVRHQYIVTS